jgi:hypothetical protein
MSTIPRLIHLFLISVMVILMVSPTIGFDLVRSPDLVLSVGNQSYDHYLDVTIVNHVTPDKVPIPLGTYVTIVDSGDFLGLRYSESPTHTVIVIFLDADIFYQVPEMTKEAEPALPGDKGYIATYEDDLTGANQPGQDGLIDTIVIGRPQGPTPIPKAPSGNSAA